MITYEYKTIKEDSILSDDRLNLYGAEGWDLISIFKVNSLVGNYTESKYSHIFKRPNA